jgi:hypothetical protein
MREHDCSIGGRNTVFHAAEGGHWESGGVGAGSTAYISPVNSTVRGSVKVISSGDGERVRGGECGEVEAMCVCGYRGGGRRRDRRGWRVFRAV